jgi:undecaprenyl diphosphate synthase
MSNSKVPAHIAIIPDGNRRWAKEKSLPSVEGHRRASENTQKLMEAARNLGVKAITFWAFSTENWNRPQEEIDALFNLLRQLISKDKETFMEKKIRFVHLGRKDRLPADIAEDIKKFEDETRHFADFTLGLALDYGGHDELVRAAKKLQDAGIEITEENIEKFLDTAEMPKIDLIIRTSGEQRLS